MLVGPLLALLGTAIAVDAVNVPRTTSHHHLSSYTTSSSSLTNATLANAPYKDPSLSVSKRVANLVSLMTIEEKVAQLQQGDVSNWLNTTSGEFNQTGLEVNFAQKAGQFYVGYPITWVRSVSISRKQKHL